MQQFFQILVHVLGVRCAHSFQLDTVLVLGLKEMHV
jgi:hypothetical protein